MLMKDKMLLLFWGLLAGAVFVGSILGFGSAVNWINAHRSSAISAGSFKIGLIVFICLVVGALFRIGLYFNNRITRRQAEKLFPPELLDRIYKAPLAKAVVEQREDLLDGLRFLPEEARIQAVNAPVHNGITPLHIAAALGRKKFCARLIKYGANVQVLDNEGQTPLDYAARLGRRETVEWLQSCKKELR